MCLVIRDLRKHIAIDEMRIIKYTFQFGVANSKGTPSHALARSPSRAARSRDRPHALARLRSPLARALALACPRMPSCARPCALARMP